MTTIGRRAADHVLSNARDSWRVILQAAVAAGLAWWLSSTLLHEPQTIFGPFAALAALLGAEGGRGKRALQVVFGVLVGVGVGELFVGLLDRGPLSVGLVALLAMTVVAAIASGSLPVIHGGIAAVIVVAMDSPASGVGRLGSAVIGGAIALVFAQLLFSPSPTRLLGRAMGEVVGAASGMLAGGLPAGGDRPRLTAALAALDDARGTADGVSRRTLRGRREAGRVHELDRRSADLTGIALDVLAWGRAEGDAAAAASLRAALGRITADPLTGSVLRRGDAPVPLRPARG